MLGVHHSADDGNPLGVFDTALVHRVESIEAIISMGDICWLAFPVKDSIFHGFPHGGTSQMENLFELLLQPFKVWESLRTSPSAFCRVWRLEL